MTSSGLHAAIRNDDTQKALAILNCKKLININEQDEQQQTALHIACSKGNLEVVQELLNKNAEVNIGDYNNWYPLHCAVSSNNLHVIYALLETPKIKVNLKTKDGNSMLHYLVRTLYPNEDEERYKQVLDLSLCMGVDVNSPSERTKEVPLHQAALRGNLVAIDFLLSNHANINAQNSFIFLPLSFISLLLKLLLLLITTSLCISKLSL